MYVYYYGVLVMLLVYCTCVVDVMCSMNGVFLQGMGPGMFLYYDRISTTAQDEDFIKSDS